jgi:hypothetical protein
MAFNTNSSYSTGTAITAALISGIGLDFRTWGQNVDAGGYNLANLAQIGGASSALLVAATKLTVSLTSTTAVQINANGTSTSNVLAGYGYRIDSTDFWRTVLSNWGGAGSYDLRTQVWNFGTSSFDTLLTIASTGKMGLGTTSPTISSTGLLHCIGDTVRLFPTARTPANSAATGNDGEVCADSSYVYVHTGGSWRRAALSTF